MCRIKFRRLLVGFHPEPPAKSMNVRLLIILEREYSSMYRKKDKTGGVSFIPFQVCTVGVGGSYWEPQRVHHTGFRFETWPCHTKDVKNGTSGYLAWRLAL